MKGKKILQFGIIVKDTEFAAKRYWELFGVGPWRLLEFHPTNVTLHEKPLKKYDGVIRAALAQMGDFQLELLQPLHGSSTYMEFAKQHGQGIHHISFHFVEDHDEMLAALRKEGYAVEMQGNLWGALTFTYMATQDDLGTIIEFLKTIPGAQNIPREYGTYPPS
jgi:4-hydroxyphenylpyruvate dioxygenase-like putative hemolysin